MLATTVRCEHKGTHLSPRLCGDGLIRGRVVDWDDEARGGDSDGRLAAKLDRKSDVVVAMRAGDAAVAANCAVEESGDLSVDRSADGPSGATGVEKHRERPPEILTRDIAATQNGGGLPVGGSGQTSDGKNKLVHGR